MSNEIKLPPLPETGWTHPNDSMKRPLFDAEQMRAYVLADRAECAHRIAGEPDGTDGVAGLRPYGFHVHGVYMRWYLKREVDALFAARPVADAGEVERLTAALKKANAQAEHFEREWYLRGDEIEGLRAAPSARTLSAEALARLTRLADHISTPGSVYFDYAADLRGLLASSAPAEAPSAQSSLKAAPEQSQSSVRDVAMQVAEAAYEAGAKRGQRPRADVLCEIVDAALQGKPEAAKGGN